MIFGVYYDMDEHIYKRHNKHLGFPAKYRREIFTDEVAERLKSVCIGISLRYEINFLEIGMEADHVHFLVQSVPLMPVSRIVITIKSITAKEIFRKHDEVKDKLWGGNIWTSDIMQIPSGCMPARM